MVTDLMDQKRGADEINTWGIIIQPQRPWFRIPVSEIWNARELVGIFVWRDFVATYKQTALRAGGIDYAWSSGRRWSIILPFGVQDFLTEGLRKEKYLIFPYLIVQLFQSLWKLFTPIKRAIGAGQHAIRR